MQIRETSEIPSIRWGWTDGRHISMSAKGNHLIVWRLTRTHLMDQEHHTDSHRFGRKEEGEEELWSIDPTNLLLLHQLTAKRLFRYSLEIHLSRKLTAIAKHYFISNMPTGDQITLDLATCNIWCDADAWEYLWCWSDVRKGLEENKKNQKEQKKLVDISPTIILWIFKIRYRLWQGIVSNNWQTHSHTGTHKKSIAGMAFVETRRTIECRQQQHHQNSFQNV